MRHHPDAVMIFAAGFGTRMGALTRATPKPLIKVAGRPLIDHALDLTRDIGTVVANTHYLPEQLSAHLAPKGVLLSHEAEILETGGGLRAALPLLGSGPVFTLNSDAVWAGANPLTSLSQHWNPDEMDALLMLIPRKHALGHAGEGDFMIDENGRLERGPGLIYSGTQIIKTSLLSQIEDDVFSLNLLWNIMAKRDRLFGMVHDGKWCDVGSPEGIVRAETMLRDV
ncbi:nucleotidyltransferase family protein [Aliiroseovarius subalbicans]|uniref:nucleotidyltransferase family protein n=1 Tax=Aliiroseovarius subalbicans TaxID=2925840 RepID=UPI001F55F299|nr:nucleotidyltransferase family protein [Aliiroseovarius subalbicans]MCI2400032.1 nucleotidyltransferase family protein [Aliiroseovarius subalbicans]